MATLWTTPLAERRSWIPAAWGDKVFSGLALAVGIIVPILTFSIGIELLTGSGNALRTFGATFVGTQTWDPVHQQFGGLAFLYGTLVTSLLALLIGGPIALGSAVVLADLAPRWMRGTLSALVELLAAIPSVVYGLWGIFVLAPLLRDPVEPFLRSTLGFLPIFQGTAYGVGFLAGGVILAIMILPTIAAVSRDVIAAVPTDQREGMLALGATRWEMIYMGVLPVARPGILGAVILGVGRALGETMAVTMLIGNRPQIVASLFAPGYTMAAVIANEFTEATYDLYLSALFEIGLLLFVVTVVVNIFARFLVWRVSTSQAGGAT